MRAIEQNETLIKGQWTMQDGRLIADANCTRIEYLIRHHLKEIKKDPTGWDTLYVDPDDGRLWELTYPASQLHGAGPPQLTFITLDQATRKYGDITPFTHLE